MSTTESVLLPIGTSARWRMVEEHTVRDGKRLYRRQIESGTILTNEDEILVTYWSGLITFIDYHLGLGWSLEHPDFVFGIIEFIKDGPAEYSEEGVRVPYRERMVRAGEDMTANQQRRIKRELAASRSARG